MLRSLSRMAAAKKVPIPRNGVDYRGKIVLAPMVRSGELPTRLVALKHNCDLVWGPETIDRSIIGCRVHENPRTKCVEFSRVPSNKKHLVEEQVEDSCESIIFRIHPARESSKLIYQVGTADPDLAVQAALTVAPYVAGIDVNSGCPKPFSTSGGMGAALMSTPDLLCDILRRLVKDVGEKFEIGISVKIRLFPNEAATRELVERLCQTGITGLTVHCRTRSMRKHERAIRHQLKMVGDICREAGVACLMNGDVEDREQAEQLIQEFGVDGAMLATAAEKNPTVFRPKEEGGAASWQELVADYMDEAIAVENRWGNTKFLLAQMIPGKTPAGRGLSQVVNYEAAVKILELDHLTERARALDERLGMTNRMTKSEQKMAAQAKRKTDPSPTNKLQPKRAKKVENPQTQHNDPPHSDYHTDLHKDIIAPILTV